MSLQHSPTIDDLIGDSLIQAVMRADRVEPQALRTLLDGAALRIGATRRRRALGSAVDRPRAPWRADGPPATGRAARASGQECGFARCL